MELIAEEEGQNLTSISGKIKRDRGPTKYYLLWLMETGIIEQREKKYYFRDHVLKEYVLYIYGGFKRTEIIQSMTPEKAKPEQSDALSKPAKELEESKLDIETDEKSEQLIEID
jgi:predicted transcriptional regulator